MKRKADAQKPKGQRIHRPVASLLSNVYLSANSVSSTTFKSLCVVSDKSLFILYICVICEKIIASRRVDE